MDNKSNSHLPNKPSNPSSSVGGARSPSDSKQPQEDKGLSPNTTASNNDSQHNSQGSSANSSSNNRVGNAIDKVGGAVDKANAVRNPIQNAGSALKNHLDNQRVKTQDEKDKANQASPNKPPSDDGFIKRNFGDKPKPSNSRGGAKGAMADKAKDGLKDKAKEAGKDAAKSALKTGAEAGAKAGAKSGASAGTTVGAKGAGAGAGIGALGALALKGWGTIFNGVKAVAASAPAAILQQSLGFVAKAATTVTTAVNGAINSVASFFGIGATASGIVPTAVVGATATTATTIGAVNVAPVIFSTNDEAACYKEDTAKKGSKNGDEASSPDSVGGGFFAEGSATHDVGQKVFDFLTKERGYSGAGAAGAVGNAALESGLNPKADNPSGGVHGIFQWSGWSSTINGNRWGAAPGGKNDTIENEIGLLGVELAGSWKKVNNSVGRATTVEDAVRNWMTDFEGVRVTDGKNAHLDTRTSHATQAYETYGGASIEANESLLNVSSNNDVAAGNESAAADSQTDDCAPSSTGAYEDGTGSVTAERGGRWHWEDLPEDLKKYAHDPRDAGMAWANSKGWWKPSGQCVGFSSSYFNLIWNVNAQGRGNGNYIAFAYSKLMKGKIDTIPRAGAITSIDAYANVVVNGKKYTGSGSQYGHTQIVQHVFENGDLLIAEQNWPGLSGDTNHTPLTWHFQLMPKELYETGKIHFFKPDESVYKLNWGD